MAELIRERSVRYETAYELQFPPVVGTGSYLSFPCDADGNVRITNPAAAENYRAVMAGERPDLLPGRVRPMQERYVTPAAVRCECGAEVDLWNSWANTCDACGREYNGSGQLLAPREQWGEETGETQADFLGL